MKENETGRIVKIKGAGETNRRLRDMGLVQGVEITIMGRAPLYDPVHIRIRDNSLTLRNNEADSIMVEVERAE
jgi:ferrous iron transport protein A